MTGSARVVIAAAVVAVAIVAAVLVERSAQGRGTGEVTSVPLLVTDLAGEPGKEVNIQLYTFPPGASVPWHIHPDAHEFNYQLEGALTLEIDGQGTKTVKSGEAAYMPPNVVHRGMNLSQAEPAKLVVVRVKPKAQPLVKEMQP